MKRGGQLWLPLLLYSTLHFISFIMPSYNNESPFLIRTSVTNFLI